MRGIVEPEPDRRDNEHRHADRGAGNAGADPDHKPVMLDKAETGDEKRNRCSSQPVNGTGMHSTRAAASSSTPSGRSAGPRKRPGSRIRMMRDSGRAIGNAFSAPARQRLRVKARFDIRSGSHKAGRPSAIWAAMKMAGMPRTRLAPGGKGSMLIRPTSTKPQPKLRSPSDSRTSPSVLPFGRFRVPTWARPRSAPLLLCFIDVSSNAILQPGRPASNTF